MIPLTLYHDSFNITSKITALLISVFLICINTLNAQKDENKNLNVIL